MAITRKPQQKRPLPGVNVDELISRGGSVAAQAQTPKSRRIAQLRLPEDLARFVDASLAWRKGVLSRNSWIVEACHEKLERDVGIRARQLAEARGLELEDVILELIESGNLDADGRPRLAQRSWFLAIKSKDGREHGQRLNSDRPLDQQLIESLEALVSSQMTPA